MTTTQTKKKKKRPSAAASAPAKKKRSAGMKVLTREIDKGVPARGVPTIDPLSIYGFKDALEAAISSGKPFSMPSHPDFPNPRTSLTDRSKEIIEDIVANKALREPIKVFKHKGEDGKYAYVLVDGMTRMTAVGRYMQANTGDASTFRTVEYMPVLLPPDQVRAYMVSWATDRENIDPLMVAKYLLYLDQRGISEEEQAVLLGKNHRGGIRWIRSMKKVARSESLSKAVVSGKISDTTARQVATKVKDEGHRAKIVERVSEAKKAEEAKAAKNGGKASPAKAEKAAAKAVGAARTNMTTLGVNEVFALVESDYVEYKQALKDDDEGKFDDVKWSNEKARDKYMDGALVVTKLETLFTVLKIGGQSASSRCKWIEARLSGGTLAALGKAGLDKYAPKDSTR